MVEYTFGSECVNETKSIVSAIQKHFPKIKIELIDSEATPTIKMEFTNELEKDKFLCEFTNILGVDEKGTYSCPDWYQIINQPYLT